MENRLHATTMSIIKRISKFAILGFVIFLYDSCETYFDSEAADVSIERPFSSESVVQMAWLNDEGEISDDITSNFAMVEKSGVEKVLLNEEYLVKVVDSANVQFHAISFFNGEIDYVPSRIVSGDNEFVISNFNETEFTFDVILIYTSDNSNSSVNGRSTENTEEKQLLTLENQRLDNSEVESLSTLRDYANTVGTGTLTGQYFNTLRIAMNEAFYAGVNKGYYNVALSQLESGNGGLLQSLNKDLNFKRYLGLNWKSKLGLEITKSISETVLKGLDWGVWDKEVSLALSGAFTIAGCLGTVGLGCGLALAGFAADAYNYYITESLPTYIVRLSHPDVRVPGNNSCNCEASKYTVTFDGNNPITIGLNEVKTIPLKAGVYEITEISTGLTNDINRTSNVTINSDNISFSLGCLCVGLNGKSSKNSNSSSKIGVLPLGT